ncbi:MAG: putative permease [Rhodobacteraceae bacterium HLUCCA08]|nr:MAG: putative permease [Rhodobacteraceae bacterium HLUCCA08]
MTATADSPDSILPGIALMLGFCVTAPMLDVCAKLAADAQSTGQITTARFVVQAVLMAPLCLALGEPLAIRRRDLGPIALRAVLLIVSTFCFVGAVAVMPIADALAIVFVMPFLLMYLAHAIFGDVVGPRRIAASGVAFIGVLLVIQPSLAAFGLVALLPLGTAVTFAGYMLVTRGLSRRVRPVAMQFQTALIASLICLPVLWAAQGSGIEVLEPVMPDALGWLWLAGVGGFAALSHLMMTYALRFAPSATLAPLQYLEIVTATLLGLLIFDDFPDRMALAGIVVIVGAGLYLIHRERVTARRPIATGSPPTGPV